MNFYADYVRNKLNAAISSMSSQIEDYVKNPGHDFTRNRKMNFTSTINFLLTMEGGSLNSELHKYFNYDLNQITRSGFIKQRNKLKPLSTTLFATSRLASQTSLTTRTIAQANILLNFLTLPKVTFGMLLVSITTNVKALPVLTSQRANMLLLFQACLRARAFP